MGVGAPLVGDVAVILAVATRMTMGGQNGKSRQMRQCVQRLLDGFKPDRAKNSCYLFHGSTPD